MQKMHGSVGATFVAEVLNEQGEVVRSTGKSPNTVLKSGIANLMAFQEYLRVCMVGSSSIAPDPTQTGLLAWKASSLDTPNYLPSITVISPNHVQLSKLYDFGNNAVIGNVTEVGCAASSGTSSARNTWNRARLLDHLGNPTTLTLVTGEKLRMRVTVDYYMYVDDTPKTIELMDRNGVVISTHTVKSMLRMATPNNGNLGGSHPDFRIAGFRLHTDNNPASSIWSSTSNSTYLSSSTYVSFYHAGDNVFRLKCKIPLANPSGFTGSVNNIGRVCFPIDGYGSSSFSANSNTASWIVDTVIDPPLTKDSTQTFELDFNIALSST